MKKTIYLLLVFTAIIFTTYSCLEEDCLEITWYQDVDGDGYGNSTATLIDCVQPDGYSSNSIDCDDTNADVNPDALEIEDNGIDDDCDGDIDEI